MKLGIVMTDGFVTKTKGDSKTMDFTYIPEVVNPGVLHIQVSESSDSWAKDINASLETNVDPVYHKDKGAGVVPFSVIITSLRSIPAGSGQSFSSHLLFNKLPL